MSRQAQRVRKLAGTLAERTGVTVDAEYDDRCWRMCWVDGPTAATMRETAEAATRHLPQLDVAELRWRRGATELAIVAAALAHLHDRPDERLSLRYRGDSLHSSTEYPERLDPALLAQARYALSHTRGWEDSAAALLAYLERAGLVGVAADLWLSTLQAGEINSPTSEQVKHDATTAPVVSADMLEPELRARVGQLVDTLVGEIAGPSDGEGPLGLRRLWAAEQARRLLLEEVDQRQRHTAAVECAGGAGLRGMSKQLGLDVSTLRKRWPRLQQEQAPLRWLHDHADEWRAAITALTSVLGHCGGVPLERDQRDRVLSLEHRSTSEDWRTLIGTPDIVRNLLPGLRRYPKGIEGELDRLKALLTRYDTASDHHS